MRIDNQDAMCLKKYDYRVLSQIYNQGTKQAMQDKESLSSDEMALIASAGHAIDLVDALKKHAAKNGKCKLDFTIETQANIGNAVVELLISDMQSGIPENKAKTEISKKVSSYLLFEIWNFMQSVKDHKTEFALSMGFDLTSGRYSVNQQVIWFINRKDDSLRSRFDIYKIGKEFAAHDVKVLDHEKLLVGVDMQSLFERVGTELKQIFQL